MSEIKKKSEIFYELITAENEKTLNKILNENKFNSTLIKMNIENFCNIYLIEKDMYRRELMYTNLMTVARSFNISVETAEATQAFFGESLWELPKEIEEDKCGCMKFPIDELPEALKNYLQAVSEYMQVAPEMCVLPMFSVLAMCVQGKAVIKHPYKSHTEPLNLYTITIASSGQRKSGCMAQFMRPVKKFQDDYNKEHMAEIEHYKTEKMFLENKRQMLITGKNADLEKAQEITDELIKLKKKREILLAVKDATPEALATIMAQHNGRMAIIDSEGAIFDVLSGIYSGGASNINLILEAYDGDDYSIIRCTRESTMIKKATLTIGIMTQPAHFEKAMANRQFVERGFLNRFLFAFPEYHVEKAELDSPDIPHEVQAEYDNIVNKLLKMPYPDTEMQTITMDKQAVTIFRQYHDLIKMQIECGMLEDMKEWALKQFGRTMRIAGILHLCSGKDAEEPLSCDTALQATRIGLWTMNHADYAMIQQSSDKLYENAKYMLLRIKESGKLFFSKTELQRVCRKIKTAEERKSTLDFLEDLNYIKIIEEKPVHSRKYKTVIKINPISFMDKKKQSLHLGINPNILKN